MAPAVTIDDVVDEVGARSVSLIKIDVQGAEMLVLEGAKRTLRKMRPALFVEVDDRALSISAHPLKRLSGILRGPDTRCMSSPMRERPGSYRTIGSSPF
jgi:hypothetical protein